MKKLLTTFILLFSISSAFALESQLFQQANQAYVENKPKKAEKIYRQLIEEYGYSASLCYNLGNALSLQEKWGEAILYYMRTRYIKPSHPGLTTNLPAAIEKAETGQTVSHGFFEGLAAKLTINQWLFSVLVISGLLMVLVLQSKIKNGFLPKSFYKSALLSLIFMLTISVAGATLQWSKLDQVVIISPEASMLVSPFKGASELKSLKGGTILTVDQSIAEYLQVHDHTGQTGWLQQNTCERIIPIKKGN